MHVVITAQIIISGLCRLCAMDRTFLPRSELLNTVSPSERREQKAPVLPHPYCTDKETESRINDKSFLKSHRELKAELGLHETLLTLIKLKCSLSLSAKNKSDIYHSPLMNTDKNCQP